MVTAYTTIWGMLFLLTMSLASDWGTLSSLTTEQWWSILYLAIICSSGGYLLWNYALSKIEVVKASVWLYLKSVAAFIGSFAIFSSVPTPLTLLGGAAILVGALLTSLSK